MTTVYAARLPRDEKAVGTDLLGGEAETRSKITDFTKQVSGTITKYFNDGKQSISTLVDKAENQLKNLRRTGSEQFNKASQSITKAVDNVRSSITGAGSNNKKPDTPKIENPISALGS